MTVVASAPPSRRQRVHEATVDEIKVVARRQMVEQGSASLTLRAVAREMGMTASALYRYFPSREDILTALIADAFDGLGAAVEAAAGDEGDHARRFVLAGRAFRGWALASPTEFGLVFGSPIPGYEAPPEATNPAAMRCSSVFSGILVDAVNDGSVDVAALGQPHDPALVALLAEVSQEKFDNLPVAAVAVGLTVWSLLYGSIAAEVFGHVPPAALVAPGALFEVTLSESLRMIGMAYPT